MVQSINLPGIFYFPWARWMNPSIALPHFSVANISKINPERLKQAGFRGLVFDKDNTLTDPYAYDFHPAIRSAIPQYREVFGDRMVIVSNSAGTRDDRDYEDARRIENSLGIHVVLHRLKKPAGIGPVLDYFRCPPSELVMFGDRIFTDIVFGNRYGMLTVHTALLTEEGDNKAAAKIRKYELPLVKKWIRQGIRPPIHSRFDSKFCLESLC